MGKKDSGMEQQEDMVMERLRAFREEYQKPRMTREQVRKLQARIEEAKKENGAGKQKGRTTLMRICGAAAAVMAMFVLLPNLSVNVASAMGRIPVIGPLVRVVTLRDYTYESQRNMAEIHVPEIEVEDIWKNQTGENSFPEAQVSDKVQEELEKTVSEINAEIREITDELIGQFETYLEDEWGYQDLMVRSEVLQTTTEYFTLKLFCYQGGGSGYQWNYYYTIDLNTGERLQLKDLFVEGADYMTPINCSIKEQMQERMDADKEVSYWLHDEIESLNFRTITEETSFYVNELGNVVIAFNEGDVAPMYMGAVEFEIPDRVLSGIRK